MFCALGRRCYSQKQLRVHWLFNVFPDFNPALLVSTINIEHTTERLVLFVCGGRGCVFDSDLQGRLPGPGGPCPGTPVVPWWRPPAGRERRVPKSRPGKPTMTPPRRAAPTRTPNTPDPHRRPHRGGEKRVLRWYTMRLRDGPE